MKAERWGSWLFRWRGRLSAILLFLAILLLRPRDPMGSDLFDELTDAIGLAIILAGFSLRIWVVGYRKSGTSGRSKEIKARELITDGAYAYVRNPLYLANLTIAFGVMIIFFNPWLFPLYLGYVFHYSLIIRGEEAYLAREFGEAYLAYKRNTPRLIPAIRGRGERPPDRKFDWNQVAKKEKDLSLGIIMGPIALEIYEDILHEGWSQFLRGDLGEIFVYLLVITLAILLWLAVTCQKRGRKI